MHSAAIFVFVGVDSNHFRYVRDFEVVVQDLVGEVPGALLIIHVWRILVLDGLLHPHISIPYVQMGRSIVLYTVSLLSRGPPLWSSGQSFWLQIQRSRVRSPALPDFLSSSGSGTGSTQPRDVKLRSYLNKKVAAPGSENRD